MWHAEQQERLARHDGSQAPVKPVLPANTLHPTVSQGCIVTCMAVRQTTPHSLRHLQLVRSCDDARNESPHPSRPTSGLRHSSFRRRTQRGKIDITTAEACFFMDTSLASILHISATKLRSTRVSELLLAFVWPGEDHRRSF